MKKKLVWLIAALVVSGLYAQAKTVITSPTGLPDESDVALESAVNAVKTIPAETVQAVGGAVSFVGDELRNTAYGVKAAFEGDTPRETVRQEMLAEVTQTWDSSDKISMRTYTVSSAVGDQLAPSSANTEATVDVRAFFKGVDFPEGTTAYYRPEVHRLVIFNNASNLSAIEEVISRYHRAERNYKQVEIKAKFIEVSQSALNQLGFSWRIEDAGPNGVNLAGDWSLNSNQDVLSTGLRSAAGALGGTPGAAGSMVLTKTGWMPLRVAISALEQAGDSDVLSSPSLTTMDGKSAEMWVGEDRDVARSFSVESSDINIHIEHKDWKSELMGVHFSVIPEIQRNNIIRLKLNPKVVDLIGYDTYKVSPKASMMMINGSTPDAYRVGGTFPILNLPAQGISKAWDQMAATISGDPNTGSTGYRNSDRMPDHEAFGVPLQAINGQLPYFRVREIKTQVDVADGSTVGLGGLIYDRLETYKDKVPVLGSIPLIGRLFRSEGERSIKRNLMIFVSASIAADGQCKSNVALNN